jgi:intracellular sulfur oxidation DsrE/DsrF family protein
MQHLNRIREFLALCLFLPGLVLAGAETQKVLYHLDSGDPGKQRDVLRMIQNHINAVEPARIDLLVVLNGNGISLLLEKDALLRTRYSGRADGDQLIAEVDNLRVQGVEFLVCAASLRARNVDRERDLHHVEEEQVLENGMLAMVRLQQQGYAYLKP